MQHIQGISRHYIQLNSLEEKITAANPVRFIEAFVTHIDVVKLGFQCKIIKSEGGPGFSTDAFLVMYQRNQKRQQTRLDGFLNL